MKGDLKYGDVVIRRGIHIMVVDPKPAEKKGDWGNWLAGMQLSKPSGSYFSVARSVEIAFYPRGECKKVEE